MQFKFRLCKNLDWMDRVCKQIKKQSYPLSFRAIILQPAHPPTHSLSILPIWGQFSWLYCLVLTWLELHLALEEVLCFISCTFTNSTAKPCQVVSSPWGWHNYGALWKLNEYSEQVGGWCKLVLRANVTSGYKRKHQPMLHTSVFKTGSLPLVVTSPEFCSQEVNPTFLTHQCSKGQFPCKLHTLYFF